MLETFSAKKGRDHENTFKPSGSLYGGSVSWYYFNYRFPSSNIKLDKTETKLDITGRGFDALCG